MASSGIGEGGGKSGPRLLVLLFLHPVCGSVFFFSARLSVQRKQAFGDEWTLLGGSYTVWCVPLRQAGLASGVGWS